MNRTFLKSVAALVVAVVIFIFGMSVGKSPAFAPTSLEVARDTETQTTSVMVDYGNGKITTISDIQLQVTSTVFDVLKSASEKNNLDLKYKDFGGDLGIFVESIGGVGKDPAGKKWWQYWVNNQYSQVGASGRVVKPGDVILFKFIEGQE